MTFTEWMKETYPESRLRLEDRTLVPYWEENGERLSKTEIDTRIVLWQLTDHRDDEE